ncbi:MAG: hypothetical protein ACJ797_01080 [Ktedonobacteraceae bacterium]
MSKPNFRVDGKGDDGLPARHFTTQLDGPSKTLLSTRTHIGMKAVRGNGSMEEEHNRAAKGQLVALSRPVKRFREPLTNT